jgi:Leucine-rich repeat (LRR) protein
MKAIIYNVPSTTPVDTFDLSGNQLTAVPSGLTQFNELTNLNLSTNAITAVETGQLKLTVAVKSLDLSFNQISAIAASSLPGNCLIVTSFYSRT